MKKENIKLKTKEAYGYVIPLGAVSLVLAKTEKGMVGCGAFDIEALDKFSYPAAKVKAKSGSIKSVQDLLDAEISLANAGAKKLGVHEGMTGRQALEIL